VPEIVRHGDKEDRARPARSALPVVDVVAGVPRAMSSIAIRHTMPRINVFYI
jgi:hypothetical protein